MACLKLKFEGVMDDNIAKKGSKSLPGAHKCHEVVQRSIKLMWITGSNVVKRCYVLFAIEG